YVQRRKEDDKEKSKRKSQGIYYTPKYIVEFIVKETLGEVLKKTKPKEISKIKILDPACGSGSFLIAAYDKILETLTKQNSQTSLFTKFDILKDNIYGVDLDVQAIEIAQLNLLLKVLSQKTKLPILQHNISSGNSLVSGNAEKLEKYFGEKWKEQKPFNFETEFKEVFETKLSKFHHLIFETKYSRQKSKDKNNTVVILEDMDRYLLAECIFKSVKKLGIKLFAGTILPDHVHLVIADMGENIEEIVNQIKGYGAFVVNRTLKDSVEGEGRQQHLWAKGCSDTFLDDEKHLFEAIEYVTNNHLKHEDTWGKIDNVKIQKSLAPFLYDINKFQWSDFEYSKGGFDVIIGNPPYVNMQLLERDEIGFYKDNFVVAKQYFNLFALFIEKSLRLLRNDGYFGFIVPSLFLKGMQYEPLRKLINATASEFYINELGDNVFENVKMPTCIFVIKKGVNKKKINYFAQQGINIFSADKTVSLGSITDITRGLEIGRDKLSNADAIVCITGSNIEPYSIKSKRYISRDTLKEFNKSSEIFAVPKILVRETGNAIVATYDDKGIITTRSLYNVRIKDKSYSLLYILALLNSKPYKYYFKSFIVPDTNIFPKIRVEQTRRIPIYKIDFSNPAEKTKHDGLVSIADKMLNLHKELRKTSENTDRWYVLKSEIEKLDSEIDEEIYKLYGLTTEEIKTIET
ncbi:MAG: TaqI-like C-terminal specificity domain-containing protein, partial [bacterium]